MKQALHAISLPFFLVFFCLFSLLLASTLFASESVQVKAKNILLVTIDTLRPDRLSCYSPEYCKTPEMDALAAQGVLFERAFAHTPTTLPSHANILLGTHPPNHGVHDNSKFKISADDITLAEHLKKSGYATAAFIGAFPLDSRFGLSQGFDVYDESYDSGRSLAFSPPERRAEKVIKSALDWLRFRDDKWFCWIHLWDPHAPYSPPQPYQDEYESDTYSGEVAYVDSQLGKLFNDMEMRDMMSETLIVLTADHGESLGEHGEATHSYFAYNSTLWVPLIISGPGLNSKSVREYACHTDIFPTICDLLGIEKPSYLQGISLVPLISGNSPGERAIYFESLAPHYNLGAAPLRGFIQGQVKFFDSPVPELYNLENDFDEGKNLVAHIDLSRYRKSLKGMIERYSAPQNKRNLAEVDRDTLEKLRSLGYVSLTSPKIKPSYGPEDDLKRLLPYHQKLDQAILLKDEGKTEEYRNLLEGLIQEKKDLVQAFIYLYRAYREEGRSEKALELLRKGVQDNPDDYNIVSNYGILLVEMRKYDQGIDVLKQALNLVDFDPLTWNSLAFAHWRKGEEEMALEYYQKSLELDNTFAMTYHSLGVFYFSAFSRSKRREDYERSMEYLKKAIEHDPNLFIAYKALGVGYKVGGRIDAAISVWEKALIINPADHSVILNLGQANFELGNKSKALQYFERYLFLNKKNLSPEERKKIELLILKCKN